MWPRKIPMCGSAHATAKSAAPTAAALTARFVVFSEASFEQREPLGEDHVLVGELRHHRRVVQEHDEDEERRDRDRDAERGHRSSKGTTLRRKIPTRRASRTFAM